MLNAIQTDQPPILKNYKYQAWDLIRQDYWRLKQQTHAAIPQANQLLVANLNQAHNCCVLGASQLSLIRAICNMGIKPVVIDFSANMCRDLRDVFDSNQCAIVLHDVTQPLPLTLQHQFDVVLADQLFNCLSREELTTAIANIASLLKPQGELRTLVKLGFYSIDKKIIMLGEHNGTLHDFYNPIHNVINYSLAKHELMAAIKPEAGVSLEVLLNWYLNRGCEQRFKLDDISDDLINSRVQNGFLEIIAREFSNDVEDMAFYCFKYHTLVN